MLKYLPTSNIDCNDWKLNFWCIIKGKMGASNIGDNNMESTHLNDCFNEHLSSGYLGYLSWPDQLSGVRRNVDNSRNMKLWPGLESRHCRQGCRKPTESVVWSWVSEATEDSLHSQQTMFYRQRYFLADHLVTLNMTLSLRRPPSLRTRRSLLYREPEDLRRVVGLAGAGRLGSCLKILSVGKTCWPAVTSKLF